MAEMLVEFSGRYAWASFAVCAMAMGLGTLTMIWHISESRSGLYVWWLVAAGAVMTLGFALGGMQAGDNPIIPREVLVPWIRLCWTVGGSIAFVFLCMYWMRRIKIIKAESRA